jgi:hypothetical protein
MNLFKKLFPKAAELKEAMRRIKNLEQYHCDLVLINKALSENYNRIDNERQKMLSELNELKDKVHGQNDADLVLASIKIINTVLNGEKPKQTEIAHQASLMAQRQAMQNSGMSHYGLSGLGGLFNWTP